VDQPLLFIFLQPTSSHFLKSLLYIKTYLQQFSTDNNN